MEEKTIIDIFGTDDRCGKIGTDVYSYIYGSGYETLSYEDLIFHFRKQPKYLAYIALDSDAIRGFIKSLDRRQQKHTENR